MEKKKKRFIVYVRCSTEDQSRGDYTTLDAQEHFCKAYLESSPGYEYIKTVRDDGHSAKNLNRPGIKSILQEAHLPEDKRTFDGIVFFKLDRLTRRMKDLYDLVDYFKDHNIEFISVQERFDTSTPHGRAMLALVGVFASLEREQLAERVRAAGVALTRQGKWTGGSVPHGYKLVPSGEPARAGREKKKLVIDEKIGPKLKVVWELAADNKSLSFIIDALTKKKIPTKTGKPWRKQTVASLIRNPYYKGYVHYGPEEVHKGDHEALIDPKLWDKANRILGANLPGHKFTKKPKKYIYLLEGLLRCGKCGSHLISAHSLGRGREPYFYYECSLMRQHKICDCKRLSATALDQAMIEFFSRASKDQRRIVQAIEKAVLASKKSLAHLDKDIRAKEKELDKVREQADKFMNLAAQSEKLSSLKTFEEKMVSFDTQKEALEMEIFNLEAKKMAAEISSDSAQYLHSNIVHVMSRFAEVSPEAQKALLQALIKEIVVYDDHIELKMFVGAESEQLLPVKTEEKGGGSKGPKGRKPSRTKAYNVSHTVNVGSPHLTASRTNSAGRLFVKLLVPLKRTRKKAYLLSLGSG